ncbi:MAG: hypothetical protein A3F70_12655 [Acidobacteria bacterium RIFCSPLOWO2_12_FULL_67_14]|nr:MAG: hypothetical protein A3F70_12655 [Acidobacteria bacterium RIFCSPLOWO2_12_FULL_67_14]
MNDMFQCGDNTALVGYLYDECDGSERAVIAAHVAICAACAAELAALESTRIQLASWTPPETELGFIVTRPRAAAEAEPPAPVRETWRSTFGAWSAQPLPAWAQVAAASVIFAVGVWLGIERGGAAGPAAPVAASAPAAAERAQGVSASDLSALERRLRDEIAGIRAASPAAPRPAVAPGAPAGADGQLMARVRGLIEESEQRQRRELALRTAQIVRDFDSQRRVDLAEIQRGFGQIEGLTGAEVREQRQLLNYLMRVSQQAP